MKFDSDPEFRESDILASLTSANPDSAAPKSRPMASLRRLATVLLALVATASASAGQQAAIPTPESSLGFAVGADFKLATYDESMPTSRSSRPPRTASGSSMSARRPPATRGRSRSSRRRRTSRSSIASKEIAQRLAHPDGSHRRRRPPPGAEGKVVRRYQRWAARVGDRRLAAHHPARVRHARPPRRPEDQGDPRQHRAVPLAVDQPRWAEHRRQLVSRERRHAVRGRRRCTSSIRSTSATTTIATRTC